MTDLSTQNQERLCDRIDKLRGDLAVRETTIINLWRSLRDAEALIAQLTIKLRDADATIEWHAQNEASR